MRISIDHAATLACEHNLEIFQVPEDYQLTEDEDGCAYHDGWYWWPCSPGCLPKGEPIGPFDTEYDASVDAVKPYIL